MRLASDGRPGARKRGYTTAWQKAAKRWLKHRPVCAMYGKQPRCQGIAYCVDHVNPHRGDMRLFWDKRNWQSLCRTCHAMKSRSEMTSRPNLINQEGLPLDPLHPWNQE